MANVPTYDPTTAPGPANNRNAVGAVGTNTGASVPTTGQIWPRGNQN